jgi:hypothetical protein
MHSVGYAADMSGGDAGLASGGRAPARCNILTNMLAESETIELI